MFKVTEDQGYATATCIFFRDFNILNHGKKSEMAVQTKCGLFKTDLTELLERNILNILVPGRFLGFWYVITI